MRLLYWYTRFLDAHGKPEKYHNCFEFEISFSTTSLFHFDVMTYCLDEKEYETPLPPDFWGDSMLYNINVLIGSNGVGKTTVIHTIINTLQKLHERELHTISDESVFVLETDNQQNKRLVVHIVGNGEDRQINCKTQQINLHQCEKEFDEELCWLLDSTKIIYVTNTLSQWDYNRCVSNNTNVNNWDYKSYTNAKHAREAFLYDCSLGGLIWSNARSDINYTEKSDVLSVYFATEYYKQVRFVCDYWQYKLLTSLRDNGLPVPVPKLLSVSIRGVPDWPALVRLDLRQKGVYEIIAYKLCLACYYSFLENTGNEKDHKGNILLPKTASFKRFKELFLEIKMRKGEKNKFVNGDSFDELREKCLNFIRFVCTTKGEFGKVLQIDEPYAGKWYKEPFYIKVEEENFDWLVKFMMLYRYTCVPQYFLDFSWGLSSGEENLLRLFSSLAYGFRHSKDELYNVGFRKPRTKCDSVLLFLDEADLTFHPEWQRQLIRILTAFLPQEFSECSVRTLQVLLATHSPLLLGDIPANNVVYLGDTKDGRRNTFGQNIHSILKDSFFLSSGVGEFATMKINQVAKVLRDAIKAEKSCVDSQAIKECKKVIDLVAPGIVKARLMKLYREATKSETSKGEEIQEYVDELTDDEIEILKDTLNRRMKRSEE